MMRGKLAVKFVSCPGRSADKFYCYFFPHRSNYPSVSRIAPNGMNVAGPFSRFQALLPTASVRESSVWAKDSLSVCTSAAIEIPGPSMQGTLGRPPPSAISLVRHRVWRLGWTIQQRNYSRCRTRTNNARYSDQCPESWTQRNLFRP